MPPSADPQAVLAALCRLHGLAPEDCSNLLPLVERALGARDSVRRQVLELVDATLARRALEASPEASDMRLLAQLADLLHGWGEGAA